MNKNILIICLIFLLAGVSAVTFSMSPPQIDFVGETNQEICSLIHLDVENPETIVGKTLWAKEGEIQRDLLRHNLSPIELGLNINFPSSVFVQDASDINICVSGKKKGHYHGILLYKIEGKPIQVGIWLNVSLGQIQRIEITGETISETRSELNYFILIGVTLFVILIRLIIIKRRN